MGLSRQEKERLSDSRMKIQSVTDSLSHVDPDKVPNLDEIEECLDEAEKNLDKALRKQ
jgi:hypothetical protein